MPLNRRFVWFASFPSVYKGEWSPPGESPCGASFFIERMKTVEIIIPHLAPGLNVLMRMHYHSYKKERDKWHYMVRSAAGRLRLARPVSIHIHRRYAGKPMDRDNLYSAAKIPLDALRYSKIIPDDDRSAVVSLKCTEEKVGKRSEQCTIIKIQEEAE